MIYSNIPLKLQKWGSYSVTKKGVFLFMERGFTVFIPNKSFKNILNTWELLNKEAKK